MLQLVRIERELPEGFDGLRAEAAAEGHRHMDRLAAEFAQAPETFIALLAAFDDGVLLGLGGLTAEPALANGAALRLRRLYVRTDARRRGVATQIANALLNEALAQTTLVTVHAGEPGAASFWAALGFDAVDGQAWSHQFAVGDHSH